MLCRARRNLETMIAEHFGEEKRLGRSRAPRAKLCEAAGLGPLFHAWTSFRRPFSAEDVSRGDSTPLASYFFGEDVPGGDPCRYFVAAVRKYSESFCSEFIRARSCSDVLQVTLSRPPGEILSMTPPELLLLLRRNSSNQV